MIITLSEEQFGELPDMQVDFLGNITMSFKVVGVSKRNFDGGLDTSKSYDIEVSDPQLTVEKMSLQDSVDRASKNNNKEVRVVPRVQNAP